MGPRKFDPSDKWSETSGPAVGHVSKPTELAKTVTSAVSDPPTQRRFLQKSSSSGRISEGWTSGLMSVARG